MSSKSFRRATGRRLIGLAFGAGLVFGATACNPGPPGDGRIEFSNGTDEQLGFEEIITDDGELPTMEELIAADTWIAPNDPGRYGGSLPTYVGVEEDKWCVRENEFMIVVKATDGEPFDLLRLGSPEAPEFEIVASYGAGLCVDSEIHEIVYEG